MQINVIKSYQQGHLSRGLTVVIDVFRAFTTACYVFQNGAQVVFPVENFNEAILLKNKLPNSLIIGEVNGHKINEADYGNSPAEIEHTSFLGKKVIITTSAGTKGLIRAALAKEIITGSFVNAMAVKDYIVGKNPRVVTLLCTDNRWEDNEDALFAEYLKGLLEKRPRNFTLIKKHLANHQCSDRFLRHHSTNLLKRDFQLAMKLNSFNFILKAETKNKILMLNQIDNFSGH